MEGGYGDGYIPQRSIYDTMCINQQIDSHHHHPGGSIRRDGGGSVIDRSYSYSASGSLRVSRSPADMFDPQPHALTPNPSFVRRLDERAIYDSLKIGDQDTDGGGCHFTRSVSPSVSSFSAPGVSSSSSKKHHHHQHSHHHQGDSTMSRDSRHSWKVLTPPKQLELSRGDMIDRGGGGYLNPGHYPPPGGQSSSLNSPLISPFSGSPLSSGYHTPVFFSPAKPRPSQSQSLRCSPPHVIQPRHYSQTQSLRLSPPNELRRSPYRTPFVELSAPDLEQDLRDQSWGLSEREREWQREREREMERGWAQREWERERERGRLERERARERERRDTSVTTFGTFGYGRPIPLRSDRDSVFLEPDQVLDTTPLLLPQPSPSPSPSVAPRMGTGAVGRHRAGSKTGPESGGGGKIPKFDNGTAGLVLVDSKTGCGPQLVHEVRGENISEAKFRRGVQSEKEAGSWNNYDNSSRASIKNGAVTRMGSQATKGTGGRVLEGKVQSGVEVENGTPAMNRERPREGTRCGDRNGRVMTKPEPIAEGRPEKLAGPGDTVEIGVGSGPGMIVEMEAVLETKASLKQQELSENKSVEAESITNVTVNNEVCVATESRVEAKVETEFKTEVEIAPTSGPESVIEPKAGIQTVTKTKTDTWVGTETQNSTNIMDEGQISVRAGNEAENAPVDDAEKKPLNIDQIDGTFIEKSSKSHKHKSSKHTSRTRPGTATGLRPGVVSPRLSCGLPGLDSTSPAEGIESTWPRRIIVRKRTVRQGGALHNLPILPPLPSVLSALEKRRPHSHFHPHPGHFSENPLSSVMNITLTSIVGRCSLKEPSNPESGHGANLVGRASLKEQNLEHWRVCRDQEDPLRARSKENKGEQRKEKTERKGNGEKTEKQEAVSKEREVIIDEEMEDGNNHEKAERQIEEYNKEQLKREKDGQIKHREEEESEIRKKDEMQEMHGKETEYVEGNLEAVEAVEGEVEGGESGTFVEEQEMEAWDDVLDMVNTTWDDSWDKGGAGEGDTDSCSGSLQRWPLLRPPVGFGGSHPPSSAASELSLTELEKRARELDIDLEHLDQSQPTRDSSDLYPTLLEPQRERGDMYQTHPGPQREKAAVLIGR